MAVVVQEDRIVHLRDRGDQKVNRPRASVLTPFGESGLSTPSSSRDAIVKRELWKQVKDARERPIVDPAPG